MFFWRSKDTFAELAKQVLHLKQLKSARTQGNAKWQLDRLVRNFGELRVSSITEQTWTDYVLRELERRKRTFADDRKYMRMVIRYALRRGLVRYEIELSIPDGPSDAGREITRAEIVRLEAAAGPDLRFQIRIAYMMGLRLREMMYLLWEQIDLKRGLIHLGKKNTRRTKTKRQRLSVIPPKLLPEFKRRRRKSTAPCVFPSPKDPSKPQDCNKTAWRNCRAKAGVNARWNDLRHTFATWLERKKWGGRVGAALMGNSEKVFNRRYVHVDEADLRRASRAING